MIFVYFMFSFIVAALYQIIMKSFPIPDNSTKELNSR